MLISHGRFVRTGRTPILVVYLQYRRIQTGSRLNRSSWGSKKRTAWAQGCTTTGSGMISKPSARQNHENTIIWGYVRAGDADETSPAHSLIMTWGALNQRTRDVYRAKGRGRPSPANDCGMDLSISERSGSHISIKPCSALIGHTGNPCDDSAGFCVDHTACRHSSGHRSAKAHPTTVAIRRADLTPIAGV